MPRYLLRGTTALVCLTLALPAAAQDEPGFLGTLVLTGGKRDLTYGTALARTVVGEQEILDRQASTVAQLIDSVPGVTLVNGTTPQGSGINIRGFGANTTYGTDQKIAVQIDGASVGSEELYRIGTQLFTDPLLYRRVEVLRGTVGSFAYGSGIVGGVVRMETKDASDFLDGDKTIGGSQTLEYSTNGRGWVSSTNLAWMPREGAEFLLNYSLRNQDDLKSGDGKTIGNSAFRTPTYLAKAKLTFGQNGDQSLSLSHSRTVADDKDVPYDQFQTTADAFGRVDRVTDTRQTVLQYRYDPGSDLVDVTATLSYADQRIGSDYVDGSSPMQGRMPKSAFCASPFTGVVCSDNRYRTTKLNVSNRAQFATGAAQHDLVVGAEAIRKQRLEAPGAPGGTDRRFAIYAVDEIKAGKVTITPALRYEKSRVESAVPLRGVPDSYSKGALMGGLALAYDVGAGVSVFGSSAYTVGLPIIDDLGSSPSAQRRINMPEKSVTLEFGAEYSGSDVLAAGDTLTVRGNFYRTRLWDITSYTAKGMMGSDLRKVQSSGFELEGSYGMAGGAYVDLAGHIGTASEYNPVGAKTDWRNSPADRVALTIGKKWDNWMDLSWEAVYAADRRDSMGAALPDVTVHNLRATWQPEQGVLQGTAIRFGVENIFDATYVGHLSSPSRKAPGRTVKLSLTKSF